MEQMNNQEEDVSILYDAWQNPIATPLLGTRLGKVSSKALGDLNAVKAEQGKKTIIEIKAKMSQRDELEARLRTAPRDSILSEQERNELLKRIDDINEEIRVKQNIIGTSFLGIFIPGQIKGSLINMYSTAVGVAASYKKSIDSRTSSLEAKVMMQRSERNQAIKDVEVLRTTHDEVGKRIENSTSQELEIKALETQLSALRNELSSFKELKKEERRTILGKVNRTKATFETIATIANKLDVLTRGILSGTKPNLSSIGGLDQQPVLRADVIADIEILNSTIAKLLDAAEEGKILISTLSEYSNEFDTLEKEGRFLDKGASMADSINTPYKSRLSEIEEELEKRRAFHRKEVIEIGRENSAQSKNITAQREIPGFDPTELIEEINETKAKIDNLEGISEAIKVMQQDNNKNQKEMEEKINKVWDKIAENQRLYQKLLQKFDSINNEYGKDVLTQVSPTEYYNPFSVELDKSEIEQLEPKIM